jgi:hypothetical protein
MNKLPKIMGLIPALQGVRSDPPLGLFNNKMGYACDRGLTLEFPGLLPGRMSKS